MGFDLYGVAPKLTEQKGLLKKLTKENGDRDWDTYEKLSQAKKDKFWEEKNAWDDNNPGNYFRNNVWYWRPLWDYVCYVCDDILTEEDVNGGHYNDSHTINGDKALDIYNRLKQEKRNGNLLKYYAKYISQLNSLPLIECKYCKGTGIRKDMKIKDGCNVCEGKGEVKQFETNYPFETGNVYQFMEFCKHSGGFQIC